MLRLATACAAAVALTISASAAVAADAQLKAAVNGAQRAPEHKARDGARNPEATLSFWGLKPKQTVIELSPGSGYWTEILAPYAKVLLDDAPVSYGGYIIARSAASISAQLPNFPQNVRMTGGCGSAVDTAYAGGLVCRVAPPPPPCAPAFTLQGMDTPPPGPPPFSCQCIMDGRCACLLQVLKLRQQVVLVAVAQRITRAVGQRTRQAVLMASAKHHRADAMSSLAAAMGAVGVLVGVPIADTLAAGVVGGMMLSMGASVARGGDH